jgi:hypothetical protein
MFIKKKVAIHGGSHHKCLVVVPPSYLIHFVLMVLFSYYINDDINFCTKSHKPLSCVWFLVNFLIDIFDCECCAICLLQQCDIMFKFLQFYDNLCGIGS